MANFASIGINCNTAVSLHFLRLSYVFSTNQIRIFFSMFHYKFLDNITVRIKIFACGLLFCTIVTHHVSWHRWFSGDV